MLFPQNEKLLWERQKLVAQRGIESDRPRAPPNIEKGLISMID
jgi:hypothetical protein